MLIPRPKLQNLLLPLLILAFVGLAVTFLRPIFGTTTRWGVLGIVLLYLLAKGGLWRPLRSRFGIATLILAVWTMATVIWSEVPLLSAMKAGAFLLVSVTCMAAGQFWVVRHTSREALGYLLPLTAVALLAGVLGRYSASAVVHSGSTTMYQGLVGGPNMFGSMLAMCLPFLLWRTYGQWRARRQRLFWLAMTGVALFYLFAASSRGAILTFLFTLSGLFLTIETGRRTHLAIMFSVLAAALLMLAPGKFEQVQRQLIYKQATEEQGVLHTREDVWQVSYEQAKKGGWLGGGYGVTIGETGFEGGLTAETYGREKGNSQLAIVEETGLVGLGIYLLLLWMLFARLLKVSLRWPRCPEKVLLGIVIGALFGMVMQSIFEAWWVAPGSPESAYFWTLVGVALGLSRLKPVPREASRSRLGRRGVEVLSPGAGSRQASARA